ncbi:MAG: IreB family regulatory phosphoprotein [Clostridiales bacterium]|nr:IreB family regulatory phosphoprotein [Clostridiales bacterium]
MNNHETTSFDFDFSNVEEIKKILLTVYNALSAKGYDPVSQMTGYLISGDPTYITSHQDARKLIREVDRDEIINELIKSYIEKE